MKKFVRILSLLLWAGVFSSIVPSARASTFVVAIRDFFYRPTNLVINVGDSVLWTNQASNPHDVTQGATNTPAGSRLWASPQLAQNATFTFTFSNAGLYPYICKTHTVDNPIAPQQTGTVTVTTANLPPNVTITSPANNASFLNQPFITITADATDTNGAVSKVDFFVGGKFIGTDSTAPYSIMASNPPLGTVSLTAVVTDNLGLSATSAPVSVIIGTRATTNTINILNSTFTNVTVAAGSLVIWTNRDTLTSHTVTGNSNSLEPLCGPSVFLSGGRNCTNRFMTPGVYPYFCSIHPTTMFGTVTVVQASSTPIVNLTRPSNGSVFVTNSSIVFEATATDADGVASVQFFHSGNMSLGADASSPYSVSGTLAAGNYFVFAKATDTLGFGALTPQVPISVVAPADLLLLSPQINGGGAMQFDLTTTPGLTYLVEQSPVLPGVWQPLTTNVATGAVLRVIDPTPITGQTQKVYRAFIRQ